MRLREVHSLAFTFAIVKEVLAGLSSTVEPAVLSFVSLPLPFRHSAMTSRTHLHHHSAFTPTAPAPRSRNDIRISGKRMPLATSSPRVFRNKSHSPVRADFGHEHIRKQFPEELSRIPDLQEALDNALDAEQYMSAAGIRDELTHAKNQDSMALMSSLLSYYDAFSSKSIERLKKLWLRSPTVVCQHPLTELHFGYDAVIRSFDTLFKTLPSDLRIDISEVRMSCHGVLGYVTCLELPDSNAISRSSNSANPARHGLLATGIFEKVKCENSDNFEYLMVHHVSSPILKTQLDI